MNMFGLARQGYRDVRPSMRAHGKVGLELTDH